MFVVDDQGLLVEPTDPVLAAELDRVNTRAETAVLYLRDAQGLKSIATPGAVASKVLSTCRKFCNRASLPNRTRMRWCRGGGAGPGACSIRYRAAWQATICNTV
jgi:hypothetical protein